jgi:hypothetical protein
MRVLILYTFCTVSIIVCAISTFFTLILFSDFGSHAEGSYSIEIYTAILLVIDIASFLVFSKMRRSLTRKKVQTKI